LKKFTLTGKEKPIFMNLLFSGDSIFILQGANMSASKGLVIIGCGGAGGPAAMLSRKINPDLDVTVVRSEPNFIVR
jgi:hypothetical protein